MRTTLLSSSGMTKRLDRMEEAGLDALTPAERGMLDDLPRTLLIRLESESA